MIKAIAQAIPVYVMGVFKLPDGVCEELTKIIRNFWWGSDNGKRKVHWKAWSQLTKSKNAGGLGFRDMKAFNQALLARQAWRLIDNPVSLCARVLKAKYYPNGCLMDTVFSGNASPTWRAIEHGLELLKEGLVWRIGNGTRVRIWRDPWIPRSSTRKVITSQGRCRIKWVADLLDANTNWNEQLVRQIFLPMDADAILSIRTSRQGEDDFLAWHLEKSGIFTVKTAYRLAIENKLNSKNSNASGSSIEGSKSLWNTIWSCPVPPKVRIFAWRVASDCLATRVNKKGRRLEALDTCTLCGTESETAFHALCRCTYARALWAALREVWQIPDQTTWTYQGTKWLLLTLVKLSEMERMFILMLLWRIWHVRNEVVHDKRHAPIEVSKRFLVSYVDSLLGIRQHPTKDIHKGKGVICYQLPNSSRQGGSERQTRLG
jgi:hypothetical protein